jgi:hypothetical protein
MDKNIALGLDIAQLKDSYAYKDIVDFITGKTTTCMYFDRLKPLYDKYGYELINNTILELEVASPIQSRPQKKEECETR